MIPLSRPIKDAEGKTLDKVGISVGTSILIPLSYLNRSPSIWGEDGNRFVPARWLRALPESVKGYSGPYHHLLSFLDGPRACPGRHFAILELKVCCHLKLPLNKG